MAQGNSGDYNKLNEDKSPASLDDEQRAQEWERRLIEGDLPEDFLKVTEPGAKDPATATLVDIPTVETTNQRDTSRPGSKPAAETTAPATKATKDRPLTTEEQDHQLALQLQQQLDLEAENEAEGGAQVPADRPRTRGMVAGGMVSQVAPANMLGRLTVSVVEAKLAKNYGLSRMDPYCRVRVGHGVYETPTCANGAKEPKWNKTFNTFLLSGVKTVDVEIFDECTFTNDALIAEASIPIPEDALIKRQEIVDDWWPLSGQEGHEKEGMLHLVLSLQPIAPGTALNIPPQVLVAPNTSSGRPMAYTTAYMPQEQQAPPKITEEDLDEFAKMFPNIDKEVILSVFQAKRGNKEATANTLLQMS